MSRGHGNLPAWANDDPKTLWKAAEEFERKNGAVYREAIIALPGELSTKQIRCSCERPSLGALCLQTVPVRYPCADVLLPRGESNPHAHVMTSDRMHDGIERPAERFFSRYNAKQPEKGGRKKASGGRDRKQLREDLIVTRKVAADTINHHLAASGHEARVDRTLKEQGVRRKPERHPGLARVRRMSRQEKAEYVAVRDGSRADEPRHP